MKHKLISFAVVLLAAAAPLFAQSRANFSWWNSPIASDINLSDAQRRQIQEIVRSYRDKLIDARAEVQKANGELGDLLNSPDVNPAKSASVVDHITKARAENSRVFTEMSLKLRAVLTLDQWRELVKKWGALQKGRRLSDTEVQP